MNYFRNVLFQSFFLSNLGLGLSTSVAYSNYTGVCCDFSLQSLKSKTHSTAIA